MERDNQEEGAAMPAAGNAGHPQPGAPVATPAAPALHEPKSCRSCGANIYWTQNERTGRAMPVDAQPTPDGNVRLFDRDGSIVSQSLGPKDRAEYLAKCAALRTEPRLRLAHHMTCAQREQWKRRR